MKYFKNIIGIGFLLVFLSLFISCSSPVEIEEQFKIETSFRPDMDIRTGFLDVVNDVLVDKAEDAGEDSVIQFESKGKPRLSPYKDVAFLTVSSAEELKKLSSYDGSTNAAISTQISSIDFNKDFIFIVGHPIPPIMVAGEINSTRALYLDKVLDIATEDSIRKIKLETSRLGNVSEGFSGFSQKWQSHIYIIPRNGCEDVLLELDKEKYPLYITK
jgi:hypothetical protein